MPTTIDFDDNAWKIGSDYAGLMILVLKESGQIETKYYGMVLVIIILVK